MSWLATWSIFELIGIGAVSDLSEPQALKNVSWQMMINKHLVFVLYFTKYCTTSKFLVFDMNAQSGGGTLLSLPTFSYTKICCFQLSLTHP